MKGSKRHQPWRPLAAAALAGACLSIIATLLATGFFRQRDLARQVAELESRATAAEAQARSETNRTRRAREQAAELIDFFVENLREELEPIGRTDIIEAAARQAEAYFESLPPDASGDSANFHHAKMLLARAQSHYDQGALPESAKAFEEALALLAGIAQPEDSKAVDHLTAMTHNELALTYTQAGRFDEARAQSGLALGAFEQLQTDEPGERAWTHGIGASKLGIAETLRRSGDHTTALGFYDEAIEFAKRAIDPDDYDVHHLATLMFAHTNKGLALSEEEEYEHCATEYEAASAIAEQLIALEPERKKWKKEYATLVNNFGSILDDQGETERARPLIEKARTLRKELISFDPANGNWRYDLANSEYNLAMNFLERSEIAQAWGAVQQYLAHTSTMLRGEPANEGWHEDMAVYVDRLTNRFNELGAYTEAAKVFEAVERLYRDLAAADPGDEKHRMRWADSLYACGKSRKRSADFESSRAHHEKALALRLALLRAEPGSADRRYELASAIGNYAQSLQNLDRFPEALAHYQFAYATYLDVPAGHRSRDDYLKLDHKNIRQARAKLGQTKTPPEIVPPRSVWHYWDAGEAPAPGWNGLKFDSDAWKSGPGQLGYGDNDEKTKIRFGPDPDNKFPTAYFRHEFEVADPASIRTIHINLIRDDGAIVYINDEEVARDMMPDGDVEFGTYATDFTPNNIENQPVWFDVPNDVKLRPGKNVLAAEIHQSDAASSDLSFDLALFKNAPVIDPLEGMDRQAYDQLLNLPLE